MPWLAALSHARRRRGDRWYEVGTGVMCGKDVPAPTRGQHAFASDDGPALNRHTAAASGERASRPRYTWGGQMSTWFVSVLELPEECWR